MSNLVCLKCLSETGDSWEQCEGKCPIPFSPHFSTAEMFEWFSEQEIKDFFKEDFNGSQG